MNSQILIQINNAKEIKIDKKEVLRYLRVPKNNNEIDSMIDDISPYVYQSIKFNALYTEIDIKINGDKIDMGIACVESKSLAKNLYGCKKAFLFVATLGIENDRAIERAFKIDSAKASVFNCISIALIESFCDYVNDYLGHDKKLRSRFSPGYGDFSIVYQKNILEALDATRKIGITLNNSYMMKPSKTVTAVIGIEEG